ncbi:DUF4401 domain-containing protein [Xanthovirga aplysinae]|uniref:DUF4401 domain-containing protein n=1 Tax=Xanthovirga aplysinae TaxID=2529853 RepID=UPI0012BBC373|nr:DUF4401 domain-containing protein [Xanthovirga aplysinae]MTI30111.1 DUF4401 domain-containing protein [Xanthovirga aplysinae]
MNKETHIKEIVEDLYLSEGAEFKCDENAILDEYQMQKENKSSLSIKILSILGGLLATLAFLVFLGVAGLYDSKLGLIIFGLGFIFSANWLNKEYDKLIIDTVSISTYVIGLALLYIGLGGFKIDENIIYIIAIIIALCTLLITQNYMLSFISVTIISGSLLTLILSNDTYNLVHLYIAFYTFLLTYYFLNEAKIISASKKLSKIYNPTRIGLLVSLLLGLTVLGKKGLIPISQNYVWLSSIPMIIGVIYLVYNISKITKIKSLKNKILINLFSVLILMPTVFAPSISGAVLIILISFLVNHKTGLVMGIISFVYFISQYYYDLNFTLLTKSIILFSSGIAFLIFYLFITRKLHAHEKI